MRHMFLTAPQRTGCCKMPFKRSNSLAMCGKDGFASTAPDVAKNLASAVAQVIGKSLPGNSEAAVCRKAI